MYFISRWIKEFAIEKMIPLMCKYVRGEMVNFLMIKKVLMAGGCVNLRTNRNDEAHYVMLTGIDAENVYIFDPYYLETSKSNLIKVNHDNPFSYNRVVKIDYFSSNLKSELTLGEENEREAIYFCRDDAILERSFN